MSNTTASSQWPSHPQAGEAAAAGPHPKTSAWHGWGAWAMPTLAPWQVKDAQHLARRGGVQAKSPCSAGTSSPWSPLAGWESWGDLPHNVSYEVMLFISSVSAKGRVQQIRRGLWLLATAGKGGRRAISSAYCMADLASRLPGRPNTCSTGMARCQ